MNKIPFSRAPVWVVVLILIPAAVCGQYSIEKQVLGAGGAESNSAEFQVMQTVAQSFIGELEGTGMMNQSGFWYMPWYLTVGDDGRDLPAAYRLYQNFPNPFNPVTTIRIALPKTSYVKLKIYDVSGREVLVVMDQTVEAGYHDIPLNPSGLASGLYFYRLEAPGFVESKKMILLR